VTRPSPSSSGAIGPSTSSVAVRRVVRLAAIGDIHGLWSAEDNRHFDGSDYDAVLVVGDLAGLRFGPTLGIAAELGRLRPYTVVVPGNHDGPNPAQLLAEVAGTPRVGDAFTSFLCARYEALEQATGSAVLGGYSAHVVGPPEDALTVVVGRPLSMGGPTLSFAGFMAARFEVRSLEESSGAVTSAQPRETGVTPTWRMR
jgi:hypothetical protein